MFDAQADAQDDGAADDDCLDGDEGAAARAAIFKARLAQAKSVPKLYKLCGDRDFWISAPCGSELRGANLEGTRITLQKAAHSGFDFTIRTPGTPPRWKLWGAACVFSRP